MIQIESSKVAKNKFALLMETRFGKVQSPLLAKPDKYECRGHSKDGPKKQ
jgi:hypothetical protein